MLMQIFVNLGQNAARFTRQGFVEVGCDIDVRGANRCDASTASTADSHVLPLRFFVRDSGVGMDEETQRTVFERFTSSGGTGLGMFIVRESVKLLAQGGDGDLSVTSPWCDDHSGSQVAFQLTLSCRAEPGAAPSAEPLALAAPAAPAVPASPAPVAPSALATRAQLAAALPAGLRVLVVDDLPMNAKLLKLAFSKCRSDWQVDTCYTTEEAVEQFAHDVLIIDEHTSDAPNALLGSDAIATIRRREAAAAEGSDERPAKRAVLISCSGDRELHGFSERAKAKGADAVWGKPFPSPTDGQMQRVLLELLEAAGYEREE